MNSGTRKTETIFQRSGGVILAIAIHVVVIYVIATSLGMVSVPSFVKPMEAMIIDQPQEVQKFEPVETPPDMTQPTLEIPETVPLIEAEIPVEAPPAESITAAPVESQPIEASNLSVTKRIDPIYPAASRRAGEEGVVTFRVLVNERGLPGEVQVLQSSGFPKLDQAAADALRKWRFQAANNGSGPVASFTTVKVRFRLDQA